MPIANPLNVELRQGFTYQGRVRVLPKLRHPSVDNFPSMRERSIQRFSSRFVSACVCSEGNDNGAIHHKRVRCHGKRVPVSTERLKQIPTNSPGPIDVPAYPGNISVH